MINKLPRAIMVCVDYVDLLQVTLPYNRHHFSEICVVTSSKDKATIDYVIGEIGKSCSNSLRLHVTDLFYADGAVFNKWRALEAALDWYGRYGLLCLMDADVLWPKCIPRINFPSGKLFSPLRRMMTEVDVGIVQNEALWERYPVHRNVNEWAGYSQVFHADDPVLGSPPWHETDWVHAGGADSFFQSRWLPENKIRPSWYCLHLGPAGENWFGRTSKYLNGKIPEDSAEKIQKTSDLWKNRRSNRSDPFRGEKIVS